MTNLSPSESSIVDMGAHLILDFYHIPTKFNLDSIEGMDSFLTNIITDSGATIESKQLKKFQPQGVSILYLLSESHFSIHTWPEANACAIDFYHCGNNAPIRLRKAEKLLCDAFGWNNCTSSLLIERGNRLKHLLDCNNDIQLLMKNLSLIQHVQSEFSDIKIFDSPISGKVLALNNQIQLTELNQDHYSNDLIKKAIDKHKSLDNLLVIGGGDFAIPELIFKRFPKLGNMTIVEIDEKVIEIANKYFDRAKEIQEKYQVSTLFLIILKDKIEIVIEDGADFVRKAYLEQKKYDAIIVDSLNLVQPNSFAQSLLKQEFYFHLKKIMKQGASFSQMLVSEQNKIIFEQMVRTAGFKEIGFLFTTLPESNISAPIGIAKKTSK